MTYRSIFKGVTSLLVFLSWRTVAACSSYVGDATINEIFKDGGENGDVFIEVNLVSPLVSSAIYNDWKVRVCHTPNKSAPVCDEILLSEMKGDSRWIWQEQPRVARSFLDFQNGFDISLMDQDNAFIDYIQINEYSNQNFDALCGYQNLNYVFGIPALTTNGTQFLLRKPDGVGQWFEDKNTSVFKPSPGQNNDGITIVDIHHFELEHDGAGLTCEAESVTIKACADASCSTLSPESVSLDILANGTVISSPIFTGSTTVSFNNTEVETLTFSLGNSSITASNSLVCDSGISRSCDIVFANAGFRFLYGAGNNTTLPNQISGATFTEILKIQAVEDTNGVCTGLFSGNKVIDLSQENVEPGGVSGLNFSTDGNNIAKYSGSTSITLNFGADSIATISAPIYNDAGQIRLRANYSAGGINLVGSSNPFWVSPAQLIVSAKSGVIDLNGATATAATTIAAGEDFDLTVAAYNAAAVPVITPNYSPGQIQFMLTRAGPTLSASVDGELRYAPASDLSSSTSPVFNNVTLSSFSSGISTYNNARYSEVGLLNLAVQDSNYGNIGIVVRAAAINLGRFTPEHFKQSVADNGFLSATCSTTTAFVAYSGQKDEATNSIGAISYLTNPVLAITAYNKQGNITRNYYQDSQGSVNDFMKLDVTNVSINTPSLDQVAVGVDTNRLPLTANMTQGTLSQNDLTALPNVVALPKGVLHYQLSDADNFFYNRSANSLVAPFTSDIDFSVAAIIDADNVDVTTTVDASPTGVEIRFGRSVLGNSYGPETSNLPQPMQLEHYNGTEFIISSDNNCSNYDASKMSLTNISLNTALTTKLGGSGSFLLGKTQAIELQAPGAGNQGQIGVSYDVYDWLKYDWDNDGIYDDSPSAIATFGIYRGNDRIIYWREVFE